MRGVLRRTTLASYRSASPQWETVLDIDGESIALEVGKVSRWIDLEFRINFLVRVHGMAQMLLMNADSAAHDFLLPHPALDWSVVLDSADPEAEEYPVSGEAVPVGKLLARSAGTDDDEFLRRVSLDMTGWPGWITMMVFLGELGIRLVSHTLSIGPVRVPADAALPTPDDVDRRCDRTPRRTSARHRGDRAGRHRDRP